MKFRVEKSAGKDYSITGKEAPRWVVIPLDPQGYSLPGDSTYHIGATFSSDGNKITGYTAETTRGRIIAHTKKATSAIARAKADARKQFGRLQNPSLSQIKSQLGKWIPAKAVRIIKQGKGIALQIASTAKKAIGNPIPSSYDYFETFYSRSAANEQAINLKRNGWKRVLVHKGAEGGWVVTAIDPSRLGMPLHSKNPTGAGFIDSQGRFRVVQQDEYWGRLKRKKAARKAARTKARKTSSKRKVSKRGRK